MKTFLIILGVAIVDTSLFSYPLSSVPFTCPPTHHHPPSLTRFFFSRSWILRQEDRDVGHRRRGRPVQLQSCVRIRAAALMKTVCPLMCHSCVFAAVFSQLLVLEGSATPLHLCLPLSAPGSHLLTACDDGLHCYNTQLGSNTKRCVRACV